MIDVSRYTVLTGHYGSGKTNFAVNLAVDLRKQGKQVTVVDLDIVNPYFRTSDFKALFEELGIRLISPPFANSNVDLPVLSATIFSVFASKDDYIIFDVGGDDAGAIALGMFHAYFTKVDYNMFYIVNCYRFLTRTSAEANALLYEIEAASRLKATGIINNSNLAKITSAQDIERSVDFAREISSVLKLPLICTTAERKLAEGLSPRIENIYPVDIYVKNVWD